MQRRARIKIRGEQGPEGELEQGGENDGEKKNDPERCFGDNESASPRAPTNRKKRSGRKKLPRWFSC